MIKIYTTNTCPKCKILKQKLDEKHIEYNECQDINFILSQGIDIVPVLEIDGDRLDFIKANKWVNEQ